MSVSETNAVANTTPVVQDYSATVLDNFDTETTAQRLKELKLQILEYSIDHTEAKLDSFNTKKTAQDAAKKPQSGFRRTWHRDRFNFNRSQQKDESVDNTDWVSKINNSTAQLNAFKSDWSAARSSRSRGRSNIFNSDNKLSKKEKTKLENERDLLKMDLEKINDPNRQPKDLDSLSKEFYLFKRENASSPEERREAILGIAKCSE